MDTLQIAGLTKKYGKKSAVEDVDLFAAKGRIVGLLGPNGSGKSTLVHCLCGVIPPTSGTILINGNDHVSKPAKRALGFMPDDLAMPDRLTGAEYLDLIRRLYGSVDRDLVLDLVDALGMSDALGTYVGQYSHGMRRKLQIVAGLAHRPSLVVLDEPLRGLDPAGQSLLTRMIVGFAAAGGTVLVATHDLRAAGDYCDEVVILSQGRVVERGNPAQLCAEYGRPDLNGVFLEATGLEVLDPGRVDRLMGALAPVDAASATPPVHPAIP